MELEVLVEEGYRGQKTGHIVESCHANDIWCIFMYKKQKKLLKKILAKKSVLSGQKTAEIGQNRVLRGQKIISGEPINIFSFCKNGTPANTHRN